MTHVSMPMAESMLGRSKVIDKISGHTIEHLAARAGSTPFYVYDFSEVTQTVESLRRALPKNCSLYYSPKVNPFPPLVQALAGLVDGFDLASEGELRMALNTGIDSRRCIFTGPAKDDKAIAAAVASGAIVNLESNDQLELVVVAAQRLDCIAHVAFRINPHQLVQTAGGGRYSKTHFGFDPTDILFAMRRAKTAGVVIEGFHGFFGSQFHDAAQIATIQESLFVLASDLASKVGLQRYFVNLGGGFAADFMEGDQPFDLVRMADCMREWTDKRQPSDGSVQLIVELGRYLVAKAGYYVARVVDRKVIGNETFVIIDGGLNHNILAAGVFGQSSASNAKLALAGLEAASRKLETVNVAGPLCSALDRFGTAVELPSPTHGDFIVVSHCGAYGLTFSPRDFLSHPQPTELLLLPACTR